MRKIFRKTIKDKYNSTKLSSLLTKDKQYRIYPVVGTGVHNSQGILMH
jgi:hypothetical protein